MAGICLLCCFNAWFGIGIVIFLVVATLYFVWVVEFPVVLYYFVWFGLVWAWNLSVGGYLLLFAASVGFGLIVGLLLRRL